MNNRKNIEQNNATSKVVGKKRVFARLLSREITVDDSRQVSYLLPTTFKINSK